MESRYIKKIQTFIDMGKHLTQLSTCKRLQVASIVFPCDCSAIYSIGYNGPAHGLPNNFCTGKEGQCGCVHAEINAITKLNIISKPSIFYTTHSPCISCAGTILNCLSIKAVIWSTTYRSDMGISLIKTTGIPVVYETCIKHIEQDLIYWKRQC